MVNQSVSCRDMSSESPERRGRSKKRPNSNSSESESTSGVSTDTYYHPLEAGERNSYRHRSSSKRRKTREMEQCKITEFTSSQEGNKSDDAGDYQNANQLILDTLVRMEKSLDENKSKTDKVTDQLEKVLSEIFEVRKENDILKNKVKKLESKCADLETEISRLDKTTKSQVELRNNLEQYTRKDNFKIINLPKDHEKETSEETQTKVLELIQKKLGLTSFSAGHISVTHRVGKFSHGQNRPVVVRLTTRKVKTEIFRQKKQLQKEKIFIYDDLTKINTQRLFNLKNHPGVLSAWSYQGKLYCKLLDLRILCVEDGDIDQIDRLLIASPATDRGDNRSHTMRARADNQERQPASSRRGRGGANSDRAAAAGRGGGTSRGFGRGRSYVSRRDAQGAPSFHVTLSNSSLPTSQEVEMQDENTDLITDCRDSNQEPGLGHRDQEDKTPQYSAQTTPT